MAGKFEGLFLIYFLLSNFEQYIKDRLKTNLIIMKNFFTFFIFFSLSFSVFSAFGDNAVSGADNTPSVALTEYRSLDLLVQGCYYAKKALHGSTYYLNAELANLSLFPKEPLICHYFEYDKQISCAPPFLSRTADDMCYAEFKISCESRATHPELCADYVPPPPDGEDGNNSVAPPSLEYPEIEFGDPLPIPTVPVGSTDPTGAVNANTVSTNVNTNNIYNLSNDVGVNSVLTDYNSKRVYENSLLLKKSNEVEKTTQGFLGRLSASMGRLSASFSALSARFSVFGTAISDLSAKFSAFNANFKDFFDIFTNDDSDHTIADKLKAKFNELKSSLVGKSYNFVSSGVTCPTWTFKSSTLLVGGLTMNSHCDILESVRPVFTSVMIAFFTIFGFRVVFSA